jgi:hypothetical protein
MEPLVSEKELSTIRSKVGLPAGGRLTDHHLMKVLQAYEEVKAARVAEPKPKVLQRDPLKHVFKKSEFSELCAICACEEGNTRHKGLAFYV